MVPNLRYNYDHDVMYSNSADSIDILVAAGGQALVDFV
jgi:hypothetical protein